MSRARSAVNKGEKTAVDFSADSGTRVNFEPEIIPSNSSCNLLESL